MAPLPPGGGAAPAADVRATRVSTAGGTDPQWGPNGSELFFLSSDNMVVSTTLPASNCRDIKFGTPAPLFPTPLRPGAEYAVVPDGQRFLVNIPAEDFAPIVILTDWNRSKP